MEALRDKLINNINLYLKSEAKYNDSHKFRFQSSIDKLQVRNVVLNLSIGSTPKLQSDTIYALISPPYGSFIRYLTTYEKFVISSIRLLHLYYGSQVTEQINSFTMQPYVIALVDNILDSEKPSKRLNAFMSVGLDMTNPLFVYYLLRGHLNIYTEFYYNHNTDKRVIEKINDMKELMEICFKKGFSPESLRGISDYNVPSYDFSSYGTKCERLLDGATGKCCRRCTIYEYAWSLYKEFVRDITLFHFLFHRTI